jgi:hypothetical protein
MTSGFPINLAVGIKATATLSEKAENSLDVGEAPKGAMGVSLTAPWKFWKSFRRRFLDRLL